MNDDNFVDPKYMDHRRHGLVDSSCEVVVKTVFTLLVEKWGEEADHALRLAAGGTSAALIQGWTWENEVTHRHMREVLAAADEHLKDAESSDKQPAAWTITKERLFALDALEGAINFVVQRTGQPLAEADQAVIRAMLAEARA